MATFEKFAFSESVNGHMVPITDSLGGAGTPVHYAVGHTGAFDEVWLYLHNRAGADANVMVTYGPNNNSISHEVRVTVPFRTVPTMVLPGIPVNNSTVIRGYCDSIGAINVLGFVNRVTP